MEADVRSSYYLLTHDTPPEALYYLPAVRGLQGVKEAKLDIKDVGELRIAVAHGLANARQLLDQLREDKKKGLPPRYHFVEFMACPGGCISGGGQPRTSVPPSDWVRQERLKSIYTLDSKLYAKRLSHENQEVQNLYTDYLGKPNGEMAHKLLHTTYTDRSVQLTAKNKA